MKKNIKKVAAVTGMSALLAVQGCGSNYNANLESEKARLESLYKMEKEKLEQEKESLVALNESLSRELEVEQKDKEELEQELSDIKEKYGIPSEKEYLKNNLTLFAIQDDGQVIYRFVQFDRCGNYSTEEYDCDYRSYCSLTHVEEEYKLKSYYYKNSEILYDAYEWSSGRNYFLPSMTSKITVTVGFDIPFPNGYEDKEIYSYDDLVEIEAIFNAKDYEIQSSPLKSEFNINELSLVHLNGYSMFVDSFYTDEYCPNSESVRDIQYLASITNPSISLKFLLNKENYRFEFDGFSCLDYNDNFWCWDMIEGDSSKMLIETDVKQYFDVAPFEKVSYEDIKEVEARLNQEYKLSLK